MTDIFKNSRSNVAYLLQRTKPTSPSFRCKTAAPSLQPNVQRRPTVVLHVAEDCPLHGSKSKCRCTPVLTDDSGLGSTDSLYQSGDFGQQQIHNNHGSDDELVETSLKPFHNNPPLPLTQRNFVGNNLHFHAPSQVNSCNELNDEQLGALMIYRDALKQNLTTPNRAGSGLPKMRLGRGGGLWRHIKQTNTYSGSNLVFIDGTVRVDDSFKYPIPHFGYPPMRRPQAMFSSSSSSNHNLSNPTTKSLETTTWSAADEVNRRPSLSQYSNRYERHAKEKFAYWPTDLTYKKPRCTPGTTGTYKTWLGLSDAVLKL